MYKEAWREGAIFQGILQYIKHRREYAFKVERERGWLAATYNNINIWRNKNSGAFYQ